MLKLETKAWVLPIFFITSILILIVDINTPRGSADFIFYFVPVALAVYHSNVRFPIYAATICTILSCIGFIISADSDVSIDITRLNRFYAIVAMWVVSYQVREIIKTRNEQTKTSWLRQGANQLAERIRGELGVSEVAHIILNFLNEKIDAQISVFYIKDSNRILSYLAGHAYKIDKDKLHIPFGEGLLGQSAQDKKIISIDSISTEHFTVSSSLGESRPKHLTLYPLVADNETLAVVEMAHFRKFETYELELLELIGESAAIAVRSAQHKYRLNELLNQAQQFTEELQAQQEELKVSNEELEQQTKVLQVTQVRLENQQSEMEQTNQQLEEQAQTLISQKEMLDEKNRDLQISKKELEEKAFELNRASQYKSEFMANMSHELRTPLNSTLILAKLLAENKSRNLTEEQIKYSEIIYNSGNDLLNLINDILDLSKVEAGKMTIIPEYIDVKQIAKSMEINFTAVAKQKNIEFRVEIDDSLPDQITTDRMRLEQILKNLLSNAFKFTAKGNVLLHVFPDNQAISFAVSDTGIGISLHEQEAIFEAFRQADGTTNRKFGGTGLGLSISKELGRILGGEIKVKSTKGEGSTFTLTLPLKYGPVENTGHFDFVNKVDVTPVVKETLPTPKVSLPETIKFSFDDDRHNIQDYSRKMLIIEDDENFAKILYELAHEMNFGAIVTATGHEGMEFAKVYAPHAIVLDIRLPDHSGMIVLDQLKMNTRTRHIPVHVISSSDFSRSAMEMGAIGYMLKPVKRDQLKVAFQNMNSMLEQKVKHVLVVEDDEIQRHHIVNLISDKTVEVDAVETSKEALEKLAKQTYDCMIMDLSLPDMSGHELLSNLSNENSIYSFPPVIVYTARDLTADEEAELRMYSGSIIIKGAKSPERLLSEVTLFLHRVETDLPLERQKMLRDLRSREKSLHEQSILIVDDDVRNIFALTSALEGYGAKIESARNGLEALAKIKNSSPIDLVLMDIMMPEMDGYEAIRQIRLMEEYKDLPIIALTAKAMKDDKDKCIEAGANDYLPKPLEVDKLLSLIKVWLPQKRTFTT